MKLITLNGKKYITKSKFSVLTDTIFLLPYSFVIDGIIKKEEWANSKQTIVDRFNLDITDINIDGRKKEYKNIPYFTWHILYNN